MKPNCDGSRQSAAGTWRPLTNYQRPCAKLLQALITIGAHAKLNAFGAQ